MHCLNIIVTIVTSVFWSDNIIIGHESTWRSATSHHVGFSIVQTSAVMPHTVDTEAWGHELQVRVEQVERSLASATPFTDLERQVNWQQWCKFFLLITNFTVCIANSVLFQILQK